MDLPVGVVLPFYLVSRASGVGHGSSVKRTRDFR
jgi:hypothetical protein